MYDSLSVVYQSFVLLHQPSSTRHRVAHELPACSRLTSRRRSSRHLLLQWQDVRQRSQRRDALRVDVDVAAHVMPLDVVKVGRHPEGIAMAPV